jgi:multidrug efflux pump subunit AcrA (membrane-fusion protein)
MKKCPWFGLVLAIFLVGCSSQPTSAVTPAATINLDSGASSSAANKPSTTGGISAQGVLVPVQEAELGYLSSGSVASVKVQLGETVQAGQVLAEMTGKEQAQAAVSVAEQAVQAAQNELDTVKRKAAEVSAQAQMDLIEKGEDLKDKKDNLSYINHLKWLRERNVEIKEINNKKGYTYPEPKDIAKAEAELALAQAIYDEGAAHLVDVQNGPDPAVLKLAEAKLKSAQDQADAARVTLDQIQIKAPFGGQISQVNVSAGDLVTPGQVLIVVTDQSHLQVRTTDLSERDVSQVKEGAQVSVWIKPLSLEVTGVVRAVSARADTIGGDVVYQTEITLNETPQTARAGMSVEVTFGK